MAASFKNIGQVIEALLAGAQAVTVPGELLDQMTANPAIEQAVKNFRADWDGRHGGRAICEL